MDESCKKLWAAVLQQAIEDIEKYSGGFDAERACAWFYNDSEETGSFKWVCSALDLNPEFIQMRVITRISKGVSNSINNSPLELYAI